MFYPDLRQYSAFEMVLVILLKIVWHVMKIGFILCTIQVLVRETHLCIIRLSRGMDTLVGEVALSEKYCLASLWETLVVERFYQIQQICFCKLKPPISKKKKKKSKDLESCFVIS